MCVSVRLSVVVHSLSTTSERRRTSSFCRFALPPLKFAEGKLIKTPFTVVKFAGIGEKTKKQKKIFSEPRRPPKSLIGERGGKKMNKRKKRRKKEKKIYYEK